MSCYPCQVTDNSKLRLSIYLILLLLNRDIYLNKINIINIYSDHFLIIGNQSTITYQKITNELIRSNIKIKKKLYNISFWYSSLRNLNERRLLIMFWVLSVKKVINYENKLRITKPDLTFCGKYTFEIYEGFLIT